MKSLKNLTQNETLRKLGNRKIVLGVVALFVVIVFIAITSFVPFTITQERLASEKFWTDELIIVGITIFSLMSTMFIGQASNAQNKDSKIAKSKVLFKESVEKIQNVNFFSQWVKRKLQPEDMQYIKERQLRKIGIDDYTILKLSDAELEALNGKAQKYNGRFYSSLNKKQIEAVKIIKEGTKKIKLVEPGYYLTVISIDIDKTDSEKSGRETFRKSIKLLFSILTKLIITIIPALILAALARDLTQEGIDKAEAFATFFSRMFALISSAFMGYIVGCQMNDIDAEYIELRCRIHTRYVQDHEFKPLSQQELAKQEYVERVRSENEKYSKTLNLKDREDLNLQLPSTVEGEE